MILNENVTENVEKTCNRRFAVSEDLMPCQSIVVVRGLLSKIPLTCGGGTRTLVERVEKIPIAANDKMARQGPRETSWQK